MSRSSSSRTTRCRGWNSASRAFATCRWPSSTMRSTDGTPAFVRERFPGAQLVEQANLGLGAGWNRGIEATDGRYVLILNADAWLTPGLARAARLVREHAS